MNYTKENTLADIVKNDFKTAKIFEKYNLDFCCKGNRSLSDAANERKLDADNILSELNQIHESQTSSANENNWSLDFLVNYILNTHHRYLKEMLPVIYNHAMKVSEVHGKHHPEVVKIADIFSNVYNELNSHMMKEEKILFPAIVKLAEAEKSGSKTELPPFGSVKNPINVMESEHTNAGENLYKLRELSNNYTIPDDACTTFSILYSELKEFEEDTHRHIHLENNILFPKAIILEEQLSGSVAK